MRLAALALFLAPALAAAGSDPDDKTLSPYFFIEGGDPAVDRMPLEKTAVTVAISGVIADIKVHQIYKNDGKRPISARYVFPASTRAAVHGLKMVVGNEVVEAKITEPPIMISAWPIMPPGASIRMRSVAPNTFW